MTLEDFGEQLDQETVDRLREIVDPVCQGIVEGQWTLGEARQVIAEARLEAALAIPDQMERFDMIYGRRFQRLLEQFPPREQ